MEVIVLTSQGRLWDLGVKHSQLLEWNIGAHQSLPGLRVPALWLLWVCFLLWKQEPPHLGATPLVPGAKLKKNNSLF